MLKKDQKKFRISTLFTQFLQTLPGLRRAVVEVSLVELRNGYLQCLCYLQFSFINLSNNFIFPWQKIISFAENHI